MKNYLPHWAAALGVLALFALFFPKLLHSPNSHLLSAAGDGLALSYNLLSHVSHDSLAFRAQYFNYPYGENLLLVDAQPAIAIGLQGVHAVWPGVSGYLVGIYTWLIVLSFVVSGVATAALLRRLGLRDWQAALGGVLLVIMCPQMYRIEGHLNLAYMAAVPMCFYLLWRFLDAKSARARWRWTAALVLNGLFWALIHGYFVLLTSGLLLGFWFFWLAISLWQRRLSIPPQPPLSKGGSLVDPPLSLMQQLLHGGVQALVPLGVFAGLVKALDFLPQRGTYFGDFTHYAATWRSTFAPIEGPLPVVYQKLFPLDKPSIWEGWAFVGTASLLVVMGLLVYGMVLFVKARWISPTPSPSPASEGGEPSRKTKFSDANSPSPASEGGEPSRKTKFSDANSPSLACGERVGVGEAHRYLLCLVLGGFLLAMFAMAIPFRYQWAESLLADDSPLRQFRALGRFNWALVYAAVLAGLYIIFLVINKIITNPNRRYRAWLAVPTLLLALYAVEGGAMWRKVGGKTPKGPNWFRADILADSAPEVLRLVQVVDSLGHQQFQAIVPLPFFYVNGVPGSGVPSEEALRQAMLLSYYSGLPLMGGFPSRASYDACRKSYGLFLPAYAAKPVLADLPNDKPLLVLDVHCPRAGEWARFFAASPLKLLATLPNGVKLYALYPKDIAQHGPELAQQFWRSDQPKLTERPTALLADSTQVPDSLPVYYNGFDDSQTYGSRPPDSVFRGSGARVIKASDITVLLDNQMLKNQDIILPEGREYCFSFWVRTTERQQFDIAVFFDTPDGWVFVNEARKCVQANGPWCLYEAFFSIPPPDQFYRLALCGNEKTPGFIALDELWVYPADQRVYRRLPSGGVELNNLSLPKP